MSTNPDGKRRLSSDGNTPKPVQKSTKMAESPQESSGENPGVIDKLTVIAKAVCLAVYKVYTFLTHLHLE